MKRLYNFIWNVTMLAALALACFHLYMNKQAIINDIYHALKMGGLL